MIKLDLSNKPSLNRGEIAKLINYHKVHELSRFKKLKGYYGTHHEYIDTLVAKRQELDPTKPNHKIISNYPQYIVDVAQNYLVGTPVTYSSTDTKFLDELTLIYDFNYEQDHNSELAKSMGIYGVAYELLYLGKDGQIYFTQLPTMETLVVESADIDPVVNLAIHYYEVDNILSDDTSYNVELYWSDRVEYWTGSSLEQLNLVNVETHEFNGVPVIAYKNNDELTGDFEKVITNINDFELRMSDMSNELDFFSNSMLVLDSINASDLQETDKDGNEIPLSITLQDMKRTKTMLLPPVAQGESAPSNRVYFVKPEIDNTANTNQLKLLINNIHLFSKVPNMNDENFVGNSSGVAMKYKLLPLEQLTKGKERKFKKGLYQRIELIADILNLKAKNVIASDINIIFTRNLPIDMTETAKMVDALKDVVSSDTLLANIPMVDNVEQEKELIEDEKENPLIPVQPVQTTASQPAVNQPTNNKNN
jgi:SPP1 family phage portal protein